MKQELVPTRISPDLLDTIGKSFKFRHPVGVAEWLKNVLDNYLRLRERGAESMPGKWPVIIQLIDASRQKNGPSLAVIDFGGSELSEINEFFLHWGSTSAASHGKKMTAAALTGGHGNGGKFYMREMWRNGARFLTFKNGRATSLVVQKRTDGNTGYWELKNQPCSWREAMAIALDPREALGGADVLLTSMQSQFPQIVSELDAGKRGFTAVVGMKALQVLSSNDFVQGGHWEHQKLVDGIRDAAQARRPIRELHVAVYINGSIAVPKLDPEPIEEDPSWDVKSLPVPTTVLKTQTFLPVDDGAGFLELRKAQMPLTGRLKDRNAILVLDQSGNPVGSYLVLRDLPLRGNSKLLEFIYGELQLTFKGQNELVQNDRDKLVPSDTTTAILDWVADQLWERVKQLEDQHRAEQEKSQLNSANKLNQELNKHLRRFLEELQTQTYVDLVKDPAGKEGEETGVGPGGDLGQGHGQGHEGEGGKKPGGKNGQAAGEGTEAGGSVEIPGTQHQRKKPRFPQVLLSDYHPDPSVGDGATSKHLTERHPPVDQDDTDKAWNIWWINTQHAFAKEAAKRGGTTGIPFKSFQLHMFRDVVQHEALRYRQRREAELSLDKVEAELTEVSNRFLGQLPYDLMMAMVSSGETEVGG